MGKGRVTWQEAALCGGEDADHLVGFIIIHLFEPLSPQHHGLLSFEQPFALDYFSPSALDLLVQEQVGWGAGSYLKSKGTPAMET